MTVTVQTDNAVRKPSFTITRDNGLIGEFTFEEAQSLVAGIVTRMVDPLSYRNSGELTAALAAVINPEIRDGLEPADLFGSMVGEQHYAAQRIAGAVVTALMNLDRR